MKSEEKNVKESKPLYCRIASMTSLVLFVVGVVCLIAKALSLETIDASGILQEKFYLLPIGFAFILGSFISFLSSCVVHLVEKIKNKNN